MPRWNGRKLWLAVLATANLAIWGTVAYGVSLIAGDRLDLGIESSVRQVQETAIASWNASRPGSAASGPAGTAGSAPGPAMLPGISSAPAGEAAAWVVSTPQPGAPETEPTSAAAADPGADSGAFPTPAPPGSASPEEAAQASAGAAAASAPLILADPPLSDLASLDQEMAGSAVGRTVQIRYLETTLNQEIAALLAASSGMPYQNVHVDLGAEQVVVKGDVLLLGLELEVEVRGTLSARGCRLHFEDRSVKIGRLFTPVTIRNGVRVLLDEALGWYPADYPLCIDGIVLQEDRATLYGHRR